jgi:hypothetical protein
MVRFVCLVALALAGCQSAKPAGPQQEPADVGRFESAAGALLRYPVRVAPSGELTFVSDARGNQVLGYRAGAPVLALTKLAEPLGLAVAGDLLYVGNARRGDVEVYSLGQKRYLRSLGGAGAFQLPNAVAVAPDGEVYVVDSRRDVVRVFGADGEPRGQFGGTGTGDGKFGFPVDVAVDATRVVVADQGNHRLQVFDRSGRFVRAFGALVTSATSRADFEGKFTSLAAVALRGADVLALDSAHSHVQVLDDHGRFKGFMGAAGDCANCTKLPLDIEVDASGRVLATDPEQRRFVTLDAEVR